MKTFYGLLISGCLLFATASFAVNIQDIQVYSALNQPLVADIPITTIDKDSFAQMVIALASADEFAQEQIPYFPWYTQLNLAKMLDARDVPVIRITSPAPVTEPTVDILIKFQFNRSIIIRQFTLLLDPSWEGVVSGRAGALSSAKIPVLRLPDNIIRDVTITHTNKLSLVDNTKALPTAKLPLPNPTELQFAVENLAKVSGPESQPLIFIPSTEAKDNLLADILPAGLSIRPQPLQITALQATRIAAGQGSKAASTVNIPKLKTTHANVTRVSPATNILPSKKPQSSSNYYLWWVLLLMVLSGLAWHYKKGLRRLLEKRLHFLTDNQVASENHKLLPTKEGSESTAETDIALQHPEGGLDPLEEAEVLYRYGRYEQAEALLLAAISNEAGRIELQMKLLEVYGAMNRPVDFENVIKNIPVEAQGLDPVYETRMQYLHDKFFNRQGLNPKDDTSASLKSESEQITSSAHQHADVADKISTAKAYIEREDYQSAREVLTGLIGNGSAEQEYEVQQLMKRLLDHHPANFKPEE